ncbi:unnamed protein product, partial [Soboliphyme baturini]|uniref:NIPA magnesium transporter 2 n=1 Tax=Soboliphyme baturini TaxID=241478 RepID=A0A183IRA7_9BILA
MGLGEALNFTAYGFAPASVVTPLGGFSVLVTAILSSRYLKEKLNILGKCGCLVSVLGATVIVLHAPKEVDVLSLTDYADRIRNSGFCYYFAFAVTLILVMVFFVAPVHGDKNLTVYILICSTVGSLGVIACKALSIATRTALIDGDGKVGLAHASLISCALLLLILCVAVQLWYLNKSLDIFDANVVTAVYYVFFTTFVIIASGLFFGEWRLMEWTDVIGSIAGFTITVIGVFLIELFGRTAFSCDSLSRLFQLNYARN